MTNIVEKIAEIISAKNGGNCMHNTATARAIIAALPGMVAPLVWDEWDGCTAQGAGGHYAMCEMKPGMFAMISPFHSFTDAPQGEVQAEANAHHAAAVVAAFTGPK